MNDTPGRDEPARPATGSARCRMCSRRDGMPCAYVDERGRSCATDWCPDHVWMVGRRLYCRRHGGIVSALTSSDGQHLPDIDNRAHSLTSWVATDLDEGMRQMLTQARRPGSDETLLVEPIGYVFTVYRTHLWERSWKLVDATGVVVKVSVDVDEANDAEVRLRVGRRTIMSLVPPWIEHRYAGPRFTSDVQARREFYAMLLAAAQEGVESLPGR